MSDFDLCIGIDYSGALTPTSRLKGLQVYAAQPVSVPPLADWSAHQPSERVGSWE